LASREVPAPENGRTSLCEVPVSHVPSSTRKAAQTRTAGSPDGFYGGFYIKWAPIAGWFVMKKPSIKGPYFRKPPYTE